MEWRLNQALAPGVYRGLVRAVQDQPARGWRLEAVDGASGPPAALPEGGPGTAMTAMNDMNDMNDMNGQEDWLVLMRRLPEDRMLDRLIERGALCTEAVDRLARVLCSFWSGAPRVTPAPQAWQDRMHTALAEHAQIWACPPPGNGAPLGAPTQPRIAQAIEGCRRLLEGCDRDLAQRMQQGRVVFGHGDLRPEHVYLPPPPSRPLVIDRLEFNETLRQVDPFEELAFLAVECRRLGAPWVGRRLFARCARLLDDHPPHRLLRLYTAQRALLQARLALAHLQETPVRDGRPWRALAAWYVECARQASGAAQGC
jgi:aminoglycoside phosphotransferase family enzyme